MEKETQNKLTELKQHLKPLGVLCCRSLFEGYCLSIEGMAFAMLVDNKFYLRVSAGSQQYIDQYQLPFLHIERCGRGISLKYYQVNNNIWCDLHKLLYLSSLSLETVREEKQQLALKKRMKDLPNITLQMENWLWQAGIKDVKTLFSYGSRKSWLKLRGFKKNLTLRTLYGLEGAIQGRHIEALSSSTRNELLEWFNQQRPEASAKS